jgi:hypothetical protein
MVPSEDISVFHNSPGPRPKPALIRAERIWLNPHRGVPRDKEDHHASDEESLD